MFVGVGASRVRDLFRQAKEKAPCIVFIDEIDAVGRARGKNVGFSSNDERENTLNQLLTEMDGFDTNSGVIILAATNRADILDTALMRAGRFDRQIHVDLPELKEREDIFNVHIRGLKISPEFDVKFMAQHTPGFSGADIANVCNEAALTMLGRIKEVDQQDFLDAVDRIVGGLEKKGSIMTQAEKRTTAYHEASRATVGWLLPYSIRCSRSASSPEEALGLTWFLPDERKILSIRADGQDVRPIGGRVAEEIINGEPSDWGLERPRATDADGLQHGSVLRDERENREISFYDSTGARGYEFASPTAKRQRRSWTEVKDLIQQIHDKTLKLLQDHKEGFVQITRSCWRKIIFADDIEKILGPKVKPQVDDSFPDETEEVNQMKEGDE